MGNRKIILVVSGEICTGKTTLASGLQSRYGFANCKSKVGLQKLAKKQLEGTEPDRGFLQKFGESLDSEGDGRWVLEYFQDTFGGDFNKKEYYVIDSVRILKQIDHLRRAYSISVVHVHLNASSKSLESRFLDRNELKNLKKHARKQRYLEFKSNDTEKQVNSLGDDADLFIDTDRCNAEDVLIQVAGFLKLLPSTSHRLVDVIVGGQFGSEGKGQIAAHIAPEYDCLVRVGGPNAGHSVYENPEKHIFHLLPSGTHRNPKAKLLIGPGAVISLGKLQNEISKFGVDDKDRLIVDYNAVVISEADVAYEQSIKLTIGSTGQGVGHATAGNILHRLNGVKTHKAGYFTSELGPYLGSVTTELEKLYSQNKRILLEGTQGSALSLHHGLYPHVTSRDTNVAGTLSEAGISPMRVRKVIMVTRTYPIRVGGESGPFESMEVDWDTVARRSDNDPVSLKQLEKTSTTHKDRRVAEFSWSMFRKACELNSPTDIALTFVDYISKSNQRARRYDQLTTETKHFVEAIERCSGAKVSLIGTCFDYRAIIDRRNW